MLQVSPTFRRSGGIPSTGGLQSGVRFLGPPSTAVESPSDAVDSLVVLEAAAAVFSGARATADGLGVADAPARASAFTRSDGDTLAAADGVSRTAALAAALGDALAASESASATVTPFVPTVRLRDTFTETVDTNLQSHTPDSGHVWTRVNGTNNFVVGGGNGLLRGGSSATFTAYTSNWALPASAHLTFRNTAVTSATGMRAGFVDADGEGYYAFWGPSTAAGNIIGFNLRKHDGTGGDLVQQPSTGTTGSKWLRLEMRDNGDGTLSFRVLASPGGTGTAADVVEVIPWQTRNPTTDGIGPIVAVGVNNASASYSSTVRIQIDEMQAGQLSAGTVADALLTSDAVSVARGLASTLSDSVTLGDAAMRSVARSLSTSDALALSEVATLGILTRTAADALALSDALARTSARARSVADALALVDGLARTSVRLRSAADALALAGAAQARRAYVRSAADALALSDAGAGMRAVLRAVSDTLTLADAAARAAASRSRNAADPLALVDAVSRAAGARVRSASDALAVFDALVAQRIVARSAADVLLLAEAVTRSVLRPRSAADALALADAVSRSAAAAQAAADGLVLTEDEARVIGRLAMLVDLLAITDSATADRLGHRLRQVRSGHVMLAPSGRVIRRRRGVMA